ncbi:FAD-dependent oxidoreductase [Pantoea agglomerans]|uniref:FAD-dependent oxidoreductase n=1 Tax=Enterobacter agglomerans TaxID=549 RepID=UPI003C7CCA32
MHTYVAIRKPMAWSFEMKAYDSHDALVRIATEFNGWDPALTALITEGQTAPIFRPIHTLSANHQWTRVPGVTLLGDAANLMEPVGEGANLAMLDGAELGQDIAAYSDDLESALAAYEARLFRRSEDASIGSAKVLNIFLDDDTPQSIVRFFQSTVGST